MRPNSFFRDGDFADFSAFANFLGLPMHDFEWSHINEKVIACNLGLRRVEMK